MSEERIVERRVSSTFQKELLNFAKECFDNNTDGLTLTLDYPQATLEVEMTFKVRKAEK